MILYTAADMSGLYRYCASQSLPTSEDTGLPGAAVASANEAVQKAIVQNTSEQPRTSKKRKYTTTFAEEDRATIGKFAAQHGNARAVNHFTMEELIPVPLSRRRLMYCCISLSSDSPKRSFRPRLAVGSVVTSLVSPALARLPNSCKYRCLKYRTVLSLKSNLPLC